jgi:glycerophosphoryl diester phosphodiesterase
MLNELTRPIIFAHRGASAQAPENTLAAFELACRQGVDAIELDAKLSADRQVVVIHDQTVDRTTEGSGQVKDLTLAELRKLDAGSHFNNAFRGERIPTLEEVLQAVGEKTFVNIELTNYLSMTDSLPDVVASLVKRYNLDQRVLFSSFNSLALRRIHRLLPESPIGLLAQPGRQGALARSFIGRLIVPYNSIHPEVRDVTPALVKRFHQRGHDIVVYTVNREEDMCYLMEMGVDGIFTDNPQLAIQVRSSLRGHTAQTETNHNASAPLI